LPRTPQANRRLREIQRTKLLEAAHRVFGRKGARATMAEIAKEAGVSQGLAYRYFPSKVAILSRLVRQLTEQGGGPAARLNALPGTPGERLRLAVAGILQAHRDQPEFYQFIYQVTRDPTLPRTLRPIVQKGGGGLVRGLRELVVEAQSSGELEPADPDQLVEALAALLEGLLARGSRVDPEVARQRFPANALVLRLLGPAGDAGRAAPGSVPSGARSAKARREGK
jgi:AcrR family transcriptional regulator